MLSNHNTMLKVETTTWHRDSHDLFDYEARHVDIKNFFVSKAAKLFRLGTEVSCITEGSAMPQSADYLLSVRFHKDGKFIVVPAERNLCIQGCQLFSKKLWMIVRKLPNNKYTIQESDVIKLGRFKLRVKQLVNNKEAAFDFKLNDVELPVVSVNTSEELNLMQCRICLLEGYQKDDPLICPCKCKGSIKFVHVQCLRQWINGRLNISESQNNVSFFFKQIQCELCNSAFPSSMLFNNEQIQIVKIPNLKPPFIVLENLVGNSNRGVHVISMAEKKDLKLGRGHESDVRIPDVSISRCHATIRFVNGVFQLEDHNSKFGTLVALKKAHPIDLGETITVQVGRSVVNFRMTNPNYQASEQLIEEVQASPPLPTNNTETVEYNNIRLPLYHNLNNAANNNSGRFSFPAQTPNLPSSLDSFYFISRMFPRNSQAFIPNSQFLNYEEQDFHTSSFPQNAISQRPFVDPSFDTNAQNPQDGISAPPRENWDNYNNVDAYSYNIASSNGYITNSDYVVPSPIDQAQPSENWDFIDPNFNN